jgi:oxygen-dependent protoporphyrinogen oxidase
LLRRRIGDEATEALVAPLLGGLFAGDVDRLSVRATFPELAVWEREHGSLFRGARAATKRAGSRPVPPMFLRLRGGLRRLVDELVAAIGPERIRLSSPVDRVERDGSRFRVRTPDGGSVTADAVVFAAPSFVTATQLENLAPQAVEHLQAIPYVSTAVVLLVYPEGTAERLPESSGFVSPRGRLAMSAATFVSRKWPEPAFGRRAVVRCFVGATGTEDLVDESDGDIVDGVSHQLAALVELPGHPEHAMVVRWPRAMPQYEVGHLDRVAAIEAALPAGAFVTGQAYRGAGIPDCVRQAGAIADGVRAHLAGRSPLDAS